MRARPCAWRWLTNRPPSGIRRIQPWRHDAGGMMQQATEVSTATYHERIAKLQEAMKEFGLQAVVLESGAAMMYLTGVRWGRSERTFAVVLPAKGDPMWVLPGFEEQRARELIRLGNDDIRVWQEDESP